MSLISGIAAALAGVLAIVLAFFHALKRGEAQGAREERTRIEAEARKEHEKIKQTAAEATDDAAQLDESDLADRLREQADRLRRR